MARVNMYASTWICTKVVDAVAVNSGPAADLEDLQI